MSAPKWGGSRARTWTRAVLARYGTDCTLHLDGCLGTATTGDHIKPYSERPDLAYDVTNGRPSCLPCNQRRGVTPLEELDATRGVVDRRDFFESARPPRRTSGGSPPRDSGKNDPDRTRR